MKLAIISLLLNLLLNPFAHSDELVFGIITDEPVRQINKITPFTNYLTSQLGKNWKARIVTKKNIKEMRISIETNEVDILMDSPFPLLMACGDHCVPSLLRWKKGVQSYRSILLVKKGSSIMNLSDLKEKTIAFEESFSSTGYILPKVILMKNKLTVAKKGDLIPKNKNKIFYQFSGEDETSLLWLLKDKVDCIALDDIFHNELSEKVKSKLRVIHKSNSIPRQILAFNKKMEQKNQQRIIDILLNIHTKEKGKTLLKQLSNTKKFSKLNLDKLNYLKEVLDHFEKI